jgi:hypothetical protein
MSVLSVIPDWWQLFIANGWFGADALYQVPSHGVALLHHVVQSIVC